VPIQPGTRLGPYEVLSAIGAGGMGEVYKARDTRLDRIVAVKVLPPHLAERSDARERFEREARTIASLNHPHICTLFDIGRQDGIDFLVMEYLEGETLAARLLKGVLPIEQVLQHAIEISDALDKAHRKGAIHRDVKPSNIMLTKAGAKLLDFGLAKLKQEIAPSIPASQLPTVKENPTVEGTILGTLQYMSPEQLEGKVDEIDSRADIFSFGAVVYEMVAGKKAFEGKTNTSVMSKIMQVDPPPMSELRPMTPAGLDRAVKRCLAKDPDDRWQSAGDLMHELKWIAERGSEETAAATKRAAPAAKPLLALGVAATALGAVVALLAAAYLKPAPALPVTRTIVTLPEGLELNFSNAQIDGPALALSPDGSQLAFAAREAGVNSRIYLRALDSLEARPVPGTDVGYNPLFSPDGQALLFFSSGALKKIMLNGGAVQTLMPAESLRGASWGSRGTMAFALSGAGVIATLPDAGGVPHPATHMEKGDATHRWPEFLPDGEALLFASSTTTVSWNNAQIVAQALNTNERHNLVQGATQPRFAPPGYLLYARAGNLLAAPFDAKRLQITGPAVTVIEGVRQSLFSGAAQYVVSRTGTLAYVPGGVEDARSKLAWVSRNGAEQLLDAPARSYSVPRISPDSARVALDPEGQIWLYDIARKTLTRLTFDGDVNIRPLWTPDGKHVIFSASKDGKQSIAWQLADGSGGREELNTAEQLQVPSSVSPDGRFLSYYLVDPNTQRDIWILDLRDRKARPFLQTRFNESASAFSPDGRWIAYASDESGRPEIYVQSFPGPGGKWQVSTEGGAQPLWNRNGRELLYRSGDRIMSMEVSVQTAFAGGVSRQVFAGRYADPVIVPTYDITPDGQRFLMLKPSEQQVPSNQIVIVQNWFEELKRRVPIGN
jgi:eukaryotic-like serine/threonine-protein kinase